MFINCRQQYSGTMVNGGAFLNGQLLANELVSTPSKISGAGPGRRRVARLCLLQYGAAKAAPILPEAAKRSNDSNNESSKRSWPWMRSMGSTRSPPSKVNAVPTGCDAPEKMSRNAHPLKVWLMVTVTGALVCSSGLNLVSGELNCVARPCGIQHRALHLISGSDIGARIDMSCSTGTIPNGT